MFNKKKDRKLKNYSDLLERTNALYKDVDELIKDMIEADSSFVPDEKLPGYFKNLLGYYQVLIKHLEDEFNISKIQRQQQMAEFQKMLELKIKKETFNIQPMDTINKKETVIKKETFNMQPMDTINKKDT